jgi:hypothetical protein
MEDAATLTVQSGLLRLHEAMLAMLLTGDQTYHKAARATASWWPTETDCQKLERRVAQVAPGTLSFTDYLNVVDCLCRRYLPDDVLLDRAKGLAVRQYLVGHLRARQIPSTTPALTVAALPQTLATMKTVWAHVTPYDQAVVEAAQANAGRLVTDLTASARSRMKKLIINAERRRLSDGRTQLADAPLAQQLREEFGELHRDWRRIAITETAINGADGFLATQVGQYVQWLAHTGACDSCKAFSGRVFQVVAPDELLKDAAQQVWVGKPVVNIGKSAAKRKRLEDGTMVDRPDEDMLVPAIPLHPHCRCVWMPYVFSPKTGVPA